METVPKSFRLGRLRDVLLGVFGMFAVAGIYLGAFFMRRPTIVLICLLLLGVLAALGRHPRMVLKIAIGGLAGPGVAGSLGAIIAGYWLLGLLQSAVCLVLVLLLARLVKASDSNYGPATHSDKVVVTCIFASVPIGLVLLLWWLAHRGYHNY
jgi:hypothetical protein